MLCPEQGKQLKLLFFKRKQKMTEKCWICQDYGLDNKECGNAILSARISRKDLNYYETDQYFWPITEQKRKREKVYKVCEECFKNAGGFEKVSV